MDTQLAAQIATEISKRLPTISWPIIAIQSAILLIVAIAGAYIGEYLRGRAKNLATKADFESLLQQLEQNTRLVERVRTEVGQQDWAQREWVTLRRLKLAELLNHAHGLVRYVESREHSAMDGARNDNLYPREEIETISTLYFLELNIPVGAFLLEATRRLLTAGELAQRILAIGTDLDARQAVFDAFLGARDLHPLINSHDEWRQASRGLLLQIVGVPQ